MNKDFTHALETVVGGPQFLQLNTFSPYFHYIGKIIFIPFKIYLHTFSVL